MKQNKISSFIKRLMFITLSVCAITTLKAPFSYAQNQDPLGMARYYFENKEYEKAIPLFKSIYDQAPFDKNIYREYLRCLLASDNQSRAEELIIYMMSITRNDPQIKIDLGNLMLQTNRPQQADKIFNELTEEVGQDQYAIDNLLNAFERNNLADYGIKLLEKLKKDDIYFNAYKPLSDLYLKQGKRDLSIKAFIEGVAHNSIMEEDLNAQIKVIIGEDKKLLDQTYKLINKEIKTNPDHIYLKIVLANLYLIEKQYNKAIDAFAKTDEQMQSNRSSMIYLSQYLADAGAYEFAYQALNKVSTHNHPAYRQAAQEQKIFLQLKELEETKPTQTKLIDQLSTSINTYFTNFEENPNPSILLLKANFIALYQDKIQEGIDLINHLITQKNIPSEIAGKAKLNLGDLLLLNNEIWDANLYYAQVDKDFKQDDLGEEARFRNAKLAFYTGDFPWAQHQLSVLKASTTELMANDALYLSVLITENQPLDSNYTPLTLFAKADLLLFQHKTSASTHLLDSILVTFPTTQLYDDILMLKAKNNIQDGNYQQAITLLKEITEKYKDDILADDALFLIAQLYEKYLDNKEQAIKYYEQLIIDFPSSTFVQSARIKHSSLMMNKTKSS